MNWVKKKGDKCLVESLGTMVAGCSVMVTRICIRGFSLYGGGGFVASRSQLGYLGYL